MQDAIEVAIASFAAVVGIVLIFAAVLGLRAFIENRKRRKARAKEEAEAWARLLDNQIAIAPTRLTDTEAAAALERARKLHRNVSEAMKTAKKTKQYERVRTYAFAGLDNLNLMRRRLGKSPGPRGPVPFGTVAGGAGRDESAHDAPTGPSTGIYFY